MGDARDFDALNGQTLLEGQTLDDNTLGDVNNDLEWLNDFPLDDNQSLFWSSWAYEIDTLGT